MGALGDYTGILEKDERGKVANRVTEKHTASEEPWWREGKPTPE